MKIFGALRKEHRFFRKLIRDMERASKKDGGEANGRIVGTLRILLTALEAHEEVEEAVFGTATYAVEKKARKIIDGVAAQHAFLESLSKKLLRALRRPERFSLQDRALATLLGLRLGKHLETEEKLLWPYYRSVWRKMGRSRTSSLEGLVRGRLRTMANPLLQD